MRPIVTCDPKWPHCNRLPRLRASVVGCPAGGLPAARLLARAFSLCLLACMLACLLVCLGGCGDALIDVADQPLSLPRLPAWLLELDAYYHLEWFDREGRLRTRRLSSADRSPVIALPKLQNVPVLVYPVIPPSASGTKAYRLLPGGAVFPRQVIGNGVLRLTWEAGPAAHLMRGVTARTGSPRSYSALRLHDELLARTAGDPWCADLEALLDLLLAGSFRVTAIRPAETAELNAAVKPGRWFSHNLLVPPVTAVGIGASGELNLSLTRGLHWYFHESGRKVLTAAVAADGTTRWALHHR